MTSRNTAVYRYHCHGISMTVCYYWAFPDIAHPYRCTEYRLTHCLAGSKARYLPGVGDVATDRRSFPSIQCRCRERTSYTQCRSQFSHSSRAVGDRHSRALCVLECPLMTSPAARQRLHGSVSRTRHWILPGVEA